jgi:hypothetical protein
MHPFVTLFKNSLHPQTTTHGEQNPFPPGAAGQQHWLGTIIHSTKPNPDSYQNKKTVVVNTALQSFNLAGN